MTVAVSTALPIAAERACELAKKPALLNHVLWPWLSATPLAPPPEPVSVGDEILVQLRFLRFLPGWKHTIRVERLVAREIVSREHGGPLKTWEHRLTFTPTSRSSCRYTDTIKIRAGIGTPLAVLFAHAIYRYRQARWRALAQVLA
jgi:hypothetical protein